jgi:transcriptional regulator with XRE-family HTH domain
MIETQLVRGVIKDYGISQKEIANLLNVDQSNVSRRLNEPIIDSITFLEAVCKLANIEMSDLLNGEIKLSMAAQNMMSNKERKHRLLFTPPPTAGEHDCEYLKIALKTQTQMISMLERQVDGLQQQIKDLSAKSAE